MENEKSKMPVNSESPVPALETNINLTTREVHETPEVARARSVIEESTETIHSILDSNEIDGPIARDDKFFKARWHQVKQAANFGKHVIDNVKDKFSISVYGERLSVLENASVRAYRATFIPMFLDLSRGTQLGMDHPDNNLMSRAAYERHQRKNSPEMSKGDWAKLGAYELLTAPVVRALGLTALYAATKPFYEKNKDGKVADVHKAAARRIERHETGEYNPVLRKKGKLHNPTGNYRIGRAVTSTKSKVILR